MTLILANLVPSFETVAIVWVIVKGRHCLENTPDLILWPGWLAGWTVARAHAFRWSGCYSLLLSLSVFI